MARSSTIQDKVYEAGDTLVVASGGTLFVESGGTVTIEDGADFNIANTATYTYADNAELYLGTDNDTDFVFDGTKLVLAAAADDTVFEIGNGTNSFDVKIFGGAAGNYATFDAGSSELIMTAYKMSFAGDLSGDHIIDIQPSASMGANKAIYIGAWGSEIACDDDGGIFRIYAQPDSGGSTSAIGFIRANTDSTTNITAFQFYTDVDSATPGPKSVEGISAMALLNAGAYTAAKTASSTEGFRAGWFKVGGSATATCNNDVCAVWLDNQMSCAVGGFESTIYSTTGGTRPDAWAYLETSSSGWDNLFYFDSSMTGYAPVGAAVDTDGNDSDISLIMNYNGTTYYIPAFAAGKLA